MRILPGDALVGGNIAPGTYLGPVHAVNVTEKYIAVLVPAVEVEETIPPVWELNQRRGEPPPLVWVSVQHRQSPTTNPVDFAHRVHWAQIQAWGNQGWADRYLDATPQGN